MRNKRILLKTGQQCEKSTTIQTLGPGSFAIVFNEIDAGQPLIIVDGHRMGFVNSLALSLSADKMYPKLRMEVIDYCLLKNVKERFERIPEIVPGASVKIKKA